MAAHHHCGPGCQPLGLYFLRRPQEAVRLVVPRLGQGQGHTSSRSPHSWLWIVGTALGNTQKHKLKSRETGKTHARAAQGAWSQSRTAESAECVCSLTQSETTLVTPAALGAQLSSCVFPPVTSMWV